MKLILSMYLFTSVASDNQKQNSQRCSVPKWQMFKKKISKYAHQIQEVKEAVFVYLQRRNKVSILKSMVSIISSKNELFLLGMGMFVYYEDFLDLICSSWQRYRA